MRRPAEWLLLGAATLGLGAGLGAAGLPSSYLFGALLAGLGAALLAPGRLEVPDHLFKVGQAVTGVTLGAYPALVDKTDSVALRLFDSPDGSARLLRHRSGHSAPPAVVRHYGDGNRLLSAGVLL